MGQIISKEKFPQTSVNVGDIIIAQPLAHRGIIFSRSVILITDYSSTGARGMIINKPSNVRVYEVVANTEVKVDNPIYYAGPESVETVSYLHNLPNIPEADYFGNDIYYGGDPSSLADLISNYHIDLTKIKFFVGFVEWESGQLEFEIATGMWWIDRITARELFIVKPEVLWSLKLYQQGHLMGEFKETFEPSLS